MPQNKNYPMINPRLLIRNLSNIPAIPTAHHVGMKQVFVANNETTSLVTQIAIGQLSPGEVVELHTHSTMDEHYLFLEGSGEMIIDGETYLCKSGTFMLIPAGAEHGLKAVSEMRFVTVGVAL